MILCLLLSNRMWQNKATKLLRLTSALQLWFWTLSMLTPVKFRSVARLRANTNLLMQTNPLIPSTDVDCLTKNCPLFRSGDTSCLFRTFLWELRWSLLHRETWHNSCLAEFMNFNGWPHTHRYIYTLNRRPDRWSQAEITHSITYS